ncbi:SGNH/GDSL hydrolase family protein [Streptomyces sp. NPDC005438]|uniref:SGNH/GDSL hydrolase family protein n=1 Tax=Streptomyces sp. NPDC005438 TaxID=3156880 RepID=UPI0033A814D5
MKSYRWAAGAAALFLGLATLSGTAQAADQSSDLAAANYVALGDSYSAGNGAGDYDDDSGDCHRSNKAYPALWASANSPSSFSFVACSGAVTDDVLNNQVSSLNSDTSLVSLSIGGNDAGFANAMTTCVTLGESACLDKVAEAKDYINNTLPGKLDKVYDAISSKAPNAKVVVLGYPHMYQLNGSCSVGISEKSREAINSASDALASVTSARVSAHGFSFGDTRDTFDGHEICSGDSWLHSVTVPVWAAYHPNANGHSGGYLPLLEQNA